VESQNQRPPQNARSADRNDRGANAAQKARLKPKAAALVYGARPRCPNVEIFADDGGFGLVFALPQKEPVPTISQADINRIIQSLRKIPIQR